jgi:alpha-tubulin suppressor-like RCC1 family protein
VRCWGDNSTGQLGNGSVGGSTSTPTVVPGLTGVTQIYGGFGNFCAQKSDGTAWCWGMQESGALGAPITNGSSTTDSGIVQTGSYTYDPILMVNSPCSGDCTGPETLTNSTVGGTCNDSNATTTVSGPSCASVTVTCSTLDGLYYTCGYDSATCHTTMTNYFSWSPVQVTGVPNPITRIGIDQWMGCALSGGQIYCWGEQSYGGLGNGTNGPGCPLTTPVIATGL